MEKKLRGQGAVEYHHKPDSIEVTKSTKGDYAWKIKIYFDTEAGKATNAHKKVTSLIKIIDRGLRKKFK